MPLTDIAIRNLKPGPDRREIPDGNGLYVVVHPSGRKSYAVRYRFGGKPRKLTLAGGLTLKAARAAASDAQLEIERGRDPGAARQIARQDQRAATDNTFRAIAEEYLKREGARLRSATWRQKALERLVYPTLGNRPIGEIRRSEIIRLLDKIEEGAIGSSEKGKNRRRGGAVMADRTLAIVRKIMNWHATRSDEFRSPIVRGMARVKAKERARTRILGDDELRAVWNAAEAGAGPFDRLVQFLLLTAARRDEAARMSRAELSGADWTLPAARNKTKLDLIRPLSEAAQQVLERTPAIAECDFVFSTNGRSPISGYSRFKKDFDERCGVTGWTLHDLRRTARSLMSRAGINSDHAERCLGHVIGGVRGVYDRHEFYAEKQKAFESLAAQIERILAPAPKNVIPIRNNVG